MRIRLQLQTHDGYVLGAYTCALPDELRPGFVVTAAAGLDNNELRAAAAHSVAVGLLRCVATIVADDDV